MTRQELITALQTMNCCSQKMGQQYIDKLSKGADCKEDLANAVLMTNLIDSICDVIPEGDLISGEQAKYTMTVTDVGNPAFNMDININIGTAIYVMTITDPARTSESVASFIANFINSLNPQSYPYTAMASGDAVTISGSNFIADNGTAISVVVINGDIVSMLPVELSGGTTPVYQGENNLSNEELQIVLEKLNKLCSIECNNIFN